MAQVLLQINLIFQHNVANYKFNRVEFNPTVFFILQTAFQPFLLALAYLRVTILYGFFCKIFSIQVIIMTSHD